MHYLPALALLYCIIAYANAAENDGYQLIWADEFETNGAPDPQKWTFEEGFVRNKELQWYQADNAFCLDGLLIIEGRRERKKNPWYKDGDSSWKKQRSHIEYTSACLTTKGLHSWKYGRFEIRARIRAEAGLWPAIWFLGVEGKWPQKGEIDLMEYYQGKILANACWGHQNPKKQTWDSSKTPISKFGGPDWDKQFHIWQMDWTKQRVDLYIDGRLLNSIDIEKAANPKGTSQGPMHPFRQAHYLLLNLAIGGNCGGDPSKTAFPSRYEIDYVRIYQKSKPAK